MERRFNDRWRKDLEVRVTVLGRREDSAFGHISNVSESGVCVSLPFRVVPGDAIQLEVADSMVFGHVVHASPEGALFRAGIEIVPVLLGESGMSKIIQATPKERRPAEPLLPRVAQTGRSK